MSLPPDTYTCPVTGLPILHKPEWNKVSFGNEYKISLDIIGTQILLTHNHGKPTLYDAQNRMNFTGQVIKQFLRNRPYIHIINYTNMKDNISLEARRHFIKELMSRKRILAVIFYGLSSALKLSVKIGLFFNQVPFTTLIAHDYTEAMESALTILNDSEQNPLIFEKKKILDNEATKLIEDLAHKKLPFDESEPDPFNRAVELLEDEIKYLEEKEDKLRQQETLIRLDKIISTRNEKARIYSKCLRPQAKVQNATK